MLTLDDFEENTISGRMHALYCWKHELYCDWGSQDVTEMVPVVALAYTTRHGWADEPKKWCWKVGNSYGDTESSAYKFDTPEEALNDLLDLGYDDPDANLGQSFVYCKECGWQGKSRDIERETVYEDYGDVDCRKCPSCGAVEYDGMELFEED